MNKKKKKLSSNFSPISLDITDVGYKGEGIAKLITELNFEKKNYNFFVPFALPNEKIIVKPTQLFSKKC
jgi:tRNA/tmRNA/rRNA uracil-C5-methylase (TrmA/RlmC/RlmD family)